MCAAPSHRRVLRKSETAGDPAFWLAKTRNEPGRLNRSAKHARKDPSRFAGYVGRVGALAVTLGVGFAVANAAAVARADTDSEATAPSGAESESDSSSADAEESTQQSDDTDGDSSDDGTSELGDDLDGDLEEDLDGDLEEDLDAVDQEAEEPDEPVDTDDEADSDDPMSPQPLTTQRLSRRPTHQPRIQPEVPKRLLTNSPQRSLARQTNSRTLTRTWSLPRRLNRTKRPRST